MNKQLLNKLRNLVHMFVIKNYIINIKYLLDQAKSKN